MKLRSLNPRQKWGQPWYKCVNPSNWWHWKGHFSYGKGNCCGCFSRARKINPSSRSLLQFLVVLLGRGSWVGIYKRLCYYSQAITPYWWKNQAKFVLYSITVRAWLCRRSLLMSAIYSLLCPKNFFLFMWGTLLMFVEVSFQNRVDYSLSIFYNFVTSSCCP